MKKARMLSSSSSNSPKVVVIPAGYRISVLCDWRDDYNPEITEIREGLSEDKAKFMTDCLKLIKANNRDEDLDMEAVKRKYIDILNRFPTIRDEMTDVVNKVLNANKRTLSNILRDTVDKLVQRPNDGAGEFMANIKWFKVEYYPVEIELRNMTAEFCESDNREATPQEYILK